MKKNVLRVLSLLLVLSVISAVFVGCGKKEEETPKGYEHVDFVAQTKLDMNSSSAKQEVTWGPNSHIDGDTSHFIVPKSFDSNGVVKARYLAIDTPESTGQIEEWGKAASNFTKSKLSTAAAIIIESDDDSWNFDGNGRYLVWVWYKPTEDAEYRNLNIELLQNGLAGSSKSAEGRYGETAVAAIYQASLEKLYVHSGEKDPDFPYDEAASVTIKELRTNPETYLNNRVAFEGMVTYNSDYIAYVESYDAETEMYYGIQVFYGYINALIPVLEQGATVRIVGVLGEHFGNYQVTDLKYDRMHPEDPANTTQLSAGGEIAYTEVTAEQFTGNTTIILNDQETTVPFAELAVATSLSMKNLEVKDIYTTVKETSSEKGAMTLTCKVDGITVVVRTAVLKDADGNLITQDAYEGKTIDVKGIVDCYEGTYQIKVLTADNITVH